MLRGCGPSASPQISFCCKKKGSQTTTDSSAYLLKVDDFSTKMQRERERDAVSSWPFHLADLIRQIMRPLHSMQKHQPAATTSTTKRPDPFSFFLTRERYSIKKPSFAYGQVENGVDCRGSDGVPAPVSLSTSQKTAVTGATSSSGVGGWGGGGGRHVNSS